MLFTGMCICVRVESEARQARCPLLLGQTGRYPTSLGSSGCLRLTKNIVQFDCRADGPK